MVRRVGSRAQPVEHKYMLEESPVSHGAHHAESVRYGNFAVLEVCPATSFDKAEVVNSISSMFPEATPLPVSPPYSPILRWKLDLSAEKEFLVKFDLLNELLLSLPVKKSCVMKAPLDVIAQTIIDEHKESEYGE
ncbi:hypothetical protein Y032_0008g257 [Ancylostoma ceylanicum]|uniref:Uncharacterized protein n=1 Tax=Ancylostoma ceylanicum TaxID=53326 RepID=A0A016VMC8_9BILA|nr:hypothetical protein Y032_0008g257 [Ancylostoma ceylanicum]